MKISAVLVCAVAAVTAPALLAQEINDAQIASIVVTANQVDIDAGKLAVTLASHPDVRTFAQLMVTDHTAVNQSAVALAAKLKVTPQDNDTSRALAAGGTKNLESLKKLRGPAFDRAYVDHEIAYHEEVLAAVDKTLIPGAKNAELKALLVKVRPAFVAHLEHAKHVRASLGGATHTVSMDAASFQPATLTIDAGDTVVWANADLMPHTATASGAQAFDSGVLVSGTSWKQTFTGKGRVAYVCAFHPTMKGTLIVR